MTDTLFTEGAPDSPLLFDSIVARIRPPSESFEVELATGDVLRFRHVQGRDAFRRIREAAHRFAEGVTAINAPEPMRPFVSSDRETMIWCHILGALCLDGGGAWGFLQIQHYGPIVFDDLLDKFKTELLHAAEQVETEEIDRAKKGSGSRCCGATGSGSPATCGESTRVNSGEMPGTTP
jgi:hypothetical protein